VSETSVLARALGDLDEAAVIDGVEQQLAAGVAPLAVLEELQRGMELVGERFECDEYFLSELIYAADIFKKANSRLVVDLEQRSTRTIGTMVLGTVKNDIHDFGKDIVGMVLRSNGIEVVDLGVNVDHDRFVDAVRENQAQLVGMSCLLTTVYEDMKATIAALEAAGLRDKVKVLVGGGPTDQTVADYVGADAYCRSAQEAVETAKRMLGEG
jgi:dimethylamine corrinoid protein